MTLGKKINSLVGIVLIILSVSIIYTGTTVITKITHENIVRIMTLEISNIIAKIETSYGILQESGVVGIDAYVTVAQQELIEDFRKVTFGKTGQLFVITKDKKVVFHEDFKEGEPFNFKFADEIITKEKGSIDFAHENKSRFCVFQNFPNWGWIIALSITKEELFNQRTLYLRTVLSITLLILLIAAGITFFFTRSITTLLRKLTLAANAIAQKAGDLTQQLQINTKDEIGQLADAFNQLIKSLREIVKQIIGGTDKVNNLAHGLSASAQEMNASSTEIGSTIQQVSKGVTEQANKTETTSRVMDEMAASVKQVSTNAQTAATASEKASSIAQKGGDLAHQAVEKMTRINEVISLSAKGVTQLTERSKQIAEIVDILTSIADQTNLLALNAAIESARAGEAGRGFAVVAEEVRKLAENSAKSAKDIRKLIFEIEHETVEAADSMKAGTKEVAEGAKIVNEVGNALIEIVQAAQNSSLMVSQIATATVQQLEGTQKVAKSIDEI
ncbi:MAG: methyl-accepting chemotaxis protein, partial [Candidatus Desantisbacteria bacterium]